MVNKTMMNKHRGQDRPSSRGNTTEGADDSSDVNVSLSDQESSQKDTEGQFTTESDQDAAEEMTAMQKKLLSQARAKGIKPSEVMPGAVESAALIKGSKKEAAVREMNNYSIDNHIKDYLALRVE